MQVNTEDITVPWGRAPDPRDFQNGRWRMAVFQDVQESNDQTKLFFLYDPVADQNSGTSGGAKGAAGLVVFDTNVRCFTRELPVQVEGVPKFLFSLKCPSPQGGTALVLVTLTETYNEQSLLLYRVDVTRDGMNIEAPPRQLLDRPIKISDDFIISMREDAPEIVVLTSPSLVVWRVNCLAEGPSPPTNNYSVPNADLSHFYDAYLSQGKVYLLSASPDGHLDYSRIHILDIAGQSQITTQTCTGDPQRGTPCARKEAALDSISGFIIMAGGEVDYGDSVTRLVDYWALNLSTFVWMQIPAQMPIPLIEPRLTATNSGHIYLWGDFDQPLPGMPDGTHLRILKVSGLHSLNPPPYNQALSQPSTAPAPYPSPPSGQQPSMYPNVQDAMGGAGQPTAPQPYGAVASPYADQKPPSYQQSQTTPYPQPNQSTPEYPQNPAYPTTAPAPYQQPAPQAPYPQPVPQAPGAHPVPQQPPIQSPGGAYAPQGGYTAPQPAQPQGQQYPEGPQQPAPGQYAYYPPTEKKSCNIQ